MTLCDKELLELAADAAHIGLMWFGNLAILRGPIENKWNPLTDDGDALRLAVKLGIEYRRITMPHNIGVQAFDGTIQAVFESYGDDQYAATRRAIVRAAAEIGKGMK